MTDANLLLGRLPSTLPGGIELDVAAAERALAGIDPAGVVDVVDAEMVRALRVVSVEQGLDPRDFALVAFGGAGPLHACALAEELGMATVLVPAAAGVLSALGLVAADERRDTVRTYVEPLTNELRDDLLQGSRARRICATTASRSSCPCRLGPRLQERFHRPTRPGTATPTASARSSSSRCAPLRSARRPTSPSPARRSRRAGPQVLELDGATAWVPTGWAGETDPHGTLILRRSP